METRNYFSESVINVDYTWPGDKSSENIKAPSSKIKTL